MAYGFDTASSFGRFFPDAEMPGYWDDLETRFKEMSTNGEVEQEFFPQFESDFRTEFLYGTEPIDERLMPREFMLAKPYKALGDFIILGLGVAVSARFREVIEQQEPGRHQFLPVKISLPSGEEYPTKYCTLRVLSVLDAWNREQSDPECWETDLGTPRIIRPKGDYSHGIALSRDVIGDHHIWRGFVSREAGLSGFKFYASDRLKAAIEEAGLKTPRFYQLKEV